MGTWLVCSQDGQTSVEAHAFEKKHKLTLVSLWFGAGFLKKKKSDLPRSPALQRAGQQHRWCSRALLPAQPFRSCFTLQVFLLLDAEISYSDTVSSPGFHPLNSSSPVVSN